MDGTLNTPQARALTGDTHKRFTVVATLLSMIDPVRGESTVHSLDRHPHDNARKQEHLQKKFLDSFALVCSTSGKGGETASAVCLEPGYPSGTVLRLARNLGVPRDLIDSLERILDDLSAVASKGMFMPAQFRMEAMSYAPLRGICERQGD